ncbi:MAG: GspH/FimT family pseudopilin [Mizugakiibacter sp.]|uniref:GspH/FimT family pseudopilin n=1 Tax=Mizugakiibacter sp. TaxID=1972610 RepID=UPI0031CAEF2F|nr:GspH/FimT family pseudopilin [Xanthomonadaceae bacterium]
MRTTRHSGFSVIELMVTVVVMAILAGIALPNFRDFMHRNAVTTATNHLLADIQYARGEAVAQHMQVTVCASTNGIACASSAPFEGGWVVVCNAPAAAATTAGTALSLGPTCPAANTLMRVGQPTAGMTMRGSSALTFQSTGSLPDGSAVATVRVCAKSSDSDSLGTNTTKVPGSLLRVDPSGRPYASAMTATDTCN